MIQFELNGYTFVVAADGSISSADAEAIDLRICQLAAREMGSSPLPIAYAVAGEMMRRYGAVMIDAPTLSAPTGDLVL